MLKVENFDATRVMNAYRQFHGTADSEYDDQYTETKVERAWELGGITFYEIVTRQSANYSSVIFMDFDRGHFACWDPMSQALELNGITQAI